MAEVATVDNRYIPPTCSQSGPIKTFKDEAIKNVIRCAIERHDSVTRSKMQLVLDSQGEHASVQLHKNCYCSFTSKDHIRREVAKKRKCGLIDGDEAPVTRVRRSQVIAFDFKKQCLFCGSACEQASPKHPDRWQRVIQCERKGREGTTPFKTVVLQCCEDRNDAWSREVALRCTGVHDLAAAEAQYHIRCYDKFRKVPVKSDQFPLIEEAMQLLVNEMYANRLVRTWTSFELHDTYMIYGGNLTRKQMLTKLLTYFGDDVTALSIEGCASIVGFREHVSKIVKISRVDNVDEDSEDTLVRQITTEARAIPSNNKNYDLGDFTYTTTKQQTSVTLLRLISKLISNGEASLSLAQSVQYHITKGRNQTTLGLAVKLHHRFGSSDLIKILHEHEYTVSYDEVLRFRKSAAKYVSNNVETLHRMMGLSWTVGLIFGWYDNFDLLVSTPNGRREIHAMATEFQMHPAGIIETGGANLGFSSLAVPRFTRKETKSVGENRAISIQHYTGPKKVLPPAVHSAKNIGLSYADLKERYTVVKQPESGRGCNRMERIQQPDLQEQCRCQTCNHLRLWSVD